MRAADASRPSRALRNGVGIDVSTESLTATSERYM